MFVELCCDASVASSEFVGFAGCAAASAVVVDVALSQHVSYRVHHSQFIMLCTVRTIIIPVNSHVCVCVCSRFLRRKLCVCVHLCSM